MAKELFLLEKEIYLFNRGELYHCYLKFGAHFITQEGESGIHFAVWAPQALRVCVLGEFNSWCGAKHQMVKSGDTGVWTLFISELKEGELYQYEILSRGGDTYIKADPFAFFSELRPGKASITYSLKGYSWLDKDWMEQRVKKNFKDLPLSIYEVHLGSWKRSKDGRFLTYRELASELIDYVLRMGYTHIELLPLMEHPYDGSWGYQGTGYYSSTSRYGTPHDLMALIDQCHQAGIGVILDWVPGHFCKDTHGLGRFDGTPLYEKDEHSHWGTYKFDFAKTEVWSFLISNALFWLDVYHFDGLRVDGVSSMLYLDYGKEEQSWEPNINGGRENLEAVNFIRRLNEVINKSYPDVLIIAEEATDWPLVSKKIEHKGLGFSFKWNMGWMNDTLRYMKLDFDERKKEHQLLTFSLMYAFSEDFVLPLSHDEVVHGKRSLLNKLPGDYWQKFSGLRSLFCYLFCHPGKKLVFMGGEIAQFIEWREDRGLDWFLLDYKMHMQFHSYARSLNTLYLREKSLWENDFSWSGFEWIDVHNHEQSILVFCRKAKAKDDFLVILINFQAIGYTRFRIGVPDAIAYYEIFNSDEERFGGSAQVNEALLIVEKISWHGRDYSLEIQVPPLGAVILKPVLE